MRCLGILTALLLVSTSAEAQRTRLTTDTTLLVTPTGSDSNPAGPFLTIPAAVKAACNQYDAAGYRLTILVDARPVPYTDSVELCDVPGSGTNWQHHPLVIQGSAHGAPVTDPCAGPLISVPGQAAIWGVGVSSIWELQGLQLQSVSADVMADRGTRINVGTIANGACSGGYPTPYKYIANAGGNIEFIGPAEVRSNGTAFLFTGMGGSAIFQTWACVMPGVQVGGWSNDGTGQAYGWIDLNPC